MGWSRIAIASVIVLASAACNSRPTGSRDGGSGTGTGNGTASPSAPTSSAWAVRAPTRSSATSRMAPIAFAMASRGRAR